MTEEFKAEYTPGEEILRIDRFLGSRLEQVSRSYIQKLVKDGVEHRYDSVPGYKHEWAFWDLELPMFLDWIPRNDAYAKMDRRMM